MPRSQALPGRQFLGPHIPLLLLSCLVPVLCPSPQAVSPTSHAKAAPLPRVAPIREIGLNPPIANLYGMQAAPQGNLWVLDGGEAKLLLYDSSLNRVKEIAGPGAVQCPLRQPVRLAAAGTTAAVAEADGRLLLYSTNGACQQTRLPAYWNPAVAFFMTEKRLFFAYAGYAADPTRTPPRELMTLFSSDWMGKDLQVYDSLPLQRGGQKPATFWLAYTSATPWGRDRWAVCRTYPREVFVFSSEGLLLRRSTRRPDLSPPMAPPPSLDETARQLFVTPRALGVFPAGELLGVLWQTPRGAAAPLRVEWLDETLVTVGEQPLAFPEPLTDKDNLQVMTTTDDHRVFLVLFHGTSRYTVTTRLFEMKLSVLEHIP